MTSLGVQLYSLRDRMADDRDGTLRRVADLGYRAVEPYDVLTDPAGLRRQLDACGLVAWSTHAPVLDRTDEVLDAAAVAGIDTVIVPAVPPAEFADRDGVARTADRLNAAAEAGAARGIRLGYHNHDWELANTVDGRPALEAFADLLAPDVVLEVDVYWAATGAGDDGAGVADLLRRQADRVRFLHVKDGPARRGVPMTAVGAGVLPIPEILAAAPDTRWIVELDECATDMVEALADSHRYLTSLT